MGYMTNIPPFSMEFKRAYRAWVSTFLYDLAKKMYIADVKVVAYPKGTYHSGDTIAEGYIETRLVVSLNGVLTTIFINVRIGLDEITLEVLDWQGVRVYTNSFTSTPKATVRKMVQVALKHYLLNEIEIECLDETPNYKLGLKVYATLELLNTIHNSFKDKDYVANIMMLDGEYSITPIDTNREGITQLGTLFVKPNERVLDYGWLLIGSQLHLYNSELLYTCGTDLSNMKFYAEDYLKKVKV